MPTIKTDSQEYKDWLAALEPADVVGVKRGQGYGDPNPFEPVLTPYAVARVTPKQLVLGRGGTRINRGTGRAMGEGHRYHIYPWGEADLQLHLAWKARHELRCLAPFMFRRLSDEGVAAVLKIIRTDPEWLKTEPEAKP